MSGFEWLFLLRDSFQWPFLVLGCGRSMIFIELVDSLLFSISCSCRKREGAEEGGNEGVERVRE